MAEPRELNENDKIMDRCNVKKFRCTDRADAFHGEENRRQEERNFRNGSDHIHRVEGRDILQNEVDGHAEAEQDEAGGYGRERNQVFQRPDRAQRYQRNGHHQDIYSGVEPPVQMGLHNLRIELTISRKTIE